MTAVPSPVTGSRSELALPLIPKLLGTSPFPAALPAELEPPPLLLLRDLPFPNGFRDAIIFDKLFSPPPPPPLLTVAAVVEDIPAPAPKTAGARRESSYSLFLSHLSLFPAYALLQPTKSLAAPSNPCPSPCLCDASDTTHPATQCPERETERGGRLLSRVVGFTVGKQYRVSRYKPARQKGGRQP